MPVNSFGIPTDPLRFRNRLRDDQQGAFKEALEGSLRALRLTDEDRVSALLDVLWQELASEAPEDALVSTLRSFLRESGLLEDARTGALQERASRIRTQIESFLAPGSVLDWGCGDAFVAELLVERAVTLVDIADHRRAMLAEELSLYNQKEPPPGLAHFYDNVLLLTVLHHAENPATTISHAVRYSNRIIVIESVPGLSHHATNSLEPIERFRVQYEYCGFVDWFYNAVICGNIPVPFNYLPAAGWCSLFAVAGFGLSARRVLGLDQPLVPEWHELLVFERLEGTSMGHPSPSRGR